MKNHITIFLILLFSLSGAAQAFNGYYPTPQPGIENPVTTIQTALDKLQKFSANRDNTRPELLRGFIENEIIPHFAFDQMTYWIAGPFARHMNASNLTDLETRVKKAFLTSLDKHLSNYNASSIRFNFRRAQYRGNNDALVTVLLFSPNQRPDRLDFRMKRL
ncbi:MAG: ABC transporter substrate-binding protein, partial [Gammaproteobacteria bacterium]|nr:ABC transporter substrate-binding protein [Gammaproteobacteria bacterium]